MFQLRDGIINVPTLLRVGEAQSTVRRKILRAELDDCFPLLNSLLRVATKVKQAGQVEPRRRIVWI